MSHRSRSRRDLEARQARQINPISPVTGSGELDPIPVKKAGRGGVAKLLTQTIKGGAVGGAVGGTIAAAKAGTSALAGGLQGAKTGIVEAAKGIDPTAGKLASQILGQGKAPGTSSTGTPVKPGPQLSQTDPSLSVGGPGAIEHSLDPERKKKRKTRFGGFDF